MKDADTCVTPVLELDEVVQDPQLLSRDMFPEYEHPTEGRVRQMGMPIKLSDTPAQFRSFAPVLGQHTDEIMRDLGYTEAQIHAMRKAGAIT